MLIEAVRKRRQLRRQQRLAGIGLNFSGGNERRVARAEGFGHIAKTLGTKRAALRRSRLRDRAWRERET
jgi:hypothetical protein